MDDDLPYIKVPLTVFRRLGHRDKNADIETMLAACLRTAPAQSQRGHKRTGQTKWKAPPRPGRRPLNPEAVSCARLSTQALCNKVSPSNLATVKRKILDLAEGEAELVVGVVLANATSNSYYLGLLVQVLSAMLPDVVATHIDQLTNEFVKGRAHLLKDDLSQDDYDTFCLFLKNKRSVRARHMCIMALGDRERVAHLVVEMLDALGKPETCHSKDLMIELLQEHCEKCPSVRKDVRLRYIAYIRDPVGAGIDLKTRFKLMDMVTSLT
jgi:hypothetical protein